MVAALMIRASPAERRAKSEGKEREWASQIHHSEIARI